MHLTLKRAGVIAAAAVLPLAVAASPAMAAKGATVSVLHAIPEGAGVDVVDIFANGELLIDNFTPGTLETVTVPAGVYELAVFADETTPEDSKAILIVEDVELTDGLNATVTANLNAKGKPALNVFVNDVSKLPAGEARLTVRHLAAAPAVDIFASKDNLLVDLANGDSEMLDVPAGSYAVAVLLAGKDKTVLGPEDIDLADGTNTIVYAWGSAEEGNLALATQVIDGLSEGPDGVPAGDGSSSDPAAPSWAFAVAALAGLGVLVAGGRLALARR